MNFRWWLRCCWDVSWFSILRKSKIEYPESFEYEMKFRVSDSVNVKHIRVVDGNWSCPQIKVVEKERDTKCQQWLRIPPTLPTLNWKVKVKLISHRRLPSGRAYLNNKLENSHPTISTSRRRRRFSLVMIFRSAVENSLDFSPDLLLFPFLENRDSIG